MQRTITPDRNYETNGNDASKIIVSEQDLVTDRSTFDARNPDSTITSEQGLLPAANGHRSTTLLPHSEPPDPKRKKPIALILAGLGVGAIAASIFGYRYWQYTSTHQSTDNAAVYGHIHQISSGKTAQAVAQEARSGIPAAQAAVREAQAGIKGYESRITPGMSAEVAIEIQ